MKTTIKTQTKDLVVKPAFQRLVSFQIGSTSVLLTQDQIGALIVGLEVAAAKAAAA